MAPMPIPPTWRRRTFLLALGWKIKFFDKPEAKAASTSSLLGWLRGIGIVGVLVGLMPMMMQTLFGWAVVICYCGVVILCIDLVRERIENYKKLFVLLAILAGVAAFTKCVVLHKSPADFIFGNSNGRLELTIRNISNTDDYKDFDVTIVPDPDLSIAIGSVSFLNAPSSCSPISNLPDQLGPKEHAILFRDSPGHWLTFPGDFRIRCSDLPRMSHVKIEMQLVQGIPMSGIVPHPVYPRMAPSYTARFTGKYRVIEINSTFKPQ